MPNNIEKLKRLDNLLDQYVKFSIHTDEHKDKKEGEYEKWDKTTKQIADKMVMGKAI